MADFDKDSKQPLVMDVQQVVKQIIDGYKNFEKRASHWVQKDGIQNCWDARKLEKNQDKKWKCVVELHQNSKTNIVTITDYGTYGLTGKRLDKKELLNEQPIDERWCRFENYAFNNKAKKKDRHLLGSRGRGKFVFSGASDTMTTLYDTLRDDKVYRLGRRIVEKLDAPTWVEEDQKAKEILIDQTDGLLQPLKHVGTRIIIMNPSKELVEDIQDGSLEQFISETWWEIIEKFDAKIIVNNGKNSKTVEPVTKDFPCSLMTPTKVTRPKTSKDQKVFIKESVPIPSTKYKIKKLYILYDPNQTFDNRQLGISVQRDGMCITHHTTDFLGTNLSEHITGYVTVDEKFQSDMRETEGPEHYSYNWSKAPTSSLSFIIKKLCKDFATEELGWKEAMSAKVTKSEQKSNERAISKANEIAKRMGFGAGGFKKKKTRGPGPGPRPKKEKIVGIDLKDLKFPTEGKERVNYGQSLKGIGARIINNTDKDLKVGIKIEVISPDGAQIFGKYIFTDSEFPSKKNDISDYQGSADIKIEKKDFSPGQYKVHASVALITPFGSLRKGQELDTSKKSFFVEMNPPEGGIWEDITAGDFKTMGKEYTGRKSYVVEGSRSGTFILYYNKDHAGHKAIKSSDDKAVGQYKYCLTIPELCMLDLEREWGGIFKPEILEKGSVEICRVMKETEEIWTDSNYVDDV